MFCSIEDYMRHRNECLFSLKLSISSLTPPTNKDENLQQSSSSNGLCVKCVRCGVSMDENKSIFVTMHPTLNHPVSSSSTDCKGEKVCEKCGLLQFFHAQQNDKESETQNDQVAYDFDTYGDHDSSTAEKGCSNEFSETQMKSIYTFELNSYQLFKKEPLSPCADCHMALVVNCNDSGCKGQVSLMLQISDQSSAVPACKCQDDKHASTEDVGIVEHVPDSYSDVSSIFEKSNLTENTSGSRINVDQMPELNAENEAAYQSYLKSLVPCSFCSRRFNPDRVTVHENACIKRPKKRQYKTPDTANK